ncbi:peptide N-acetyl-beta-D-glucosaminyl asparaginase amidase A-domain-containing protein [Collybia nuda]|uniref:Peptide N-acetyl-beta-D-glucosaminyl asparaginase amidase A-domain-containing protein n=1 Tax=Collybia nuda TaxID=64659 RepID=A0A9P6CC68_9AGAR|nr:peptide N-acetyl-beta-D-glucosaminyl asparaginase amidase A-domain-containing protein [Collybia nuda]
MSAGELAALLHGLEEYSQNPELERRVPLSTDDPTVAPLAELQVFAPPTIPDGGNSCSLELLKHSFGDGSYNTPAVIRYAPPTSPSCGEIGKWAAITLNLTVSSAGTQYDRLSAIYLSHTEIWRSSSAEPTKTGTTWETVKDVTHFRPLFSTEGDLMMDFSNIIAPELLLDGEFNVVLTTTFYGPTSKFTAPKIADLIIPLSNLSPTLPNFFTIDNDIGASTDISLPTNSIEAFVEIFCSGNAAEEFWYLNTPDEFVSYFPESTGIIGKGPFREVQVLVDDQLAGVVWPYPVIYTGGITPSNWRPLASYGAFDAPSYWIDITPFFPILLSGKALHNITLRIAGQGTKPSINSNWFVSGSVHIRTGKSTTTGKITNYHAPDLIIETVGGAGPLNETVWTRVNASRALTIESILFTSEGERMVKFSQSLGYTNQAMYEDEGWVQFAEQTITGTTISIHGKNTILRDAFTYPLTVSSNYTLYTAEFGGYGSEIHQMHMRSLTPPVGTHRSVYSDQHAKGHIGMDNWPGLRHAINGTGTTNQTFAYMDGRGETYFRDLAAKNDGWVRDKVWGTLRDRNPPVSDDQIFGPGGGPGFRRRMVRRGPYKPVNK